MWIIVDNLKFSELAREFLRDVSGELDPHMSNKSEIVEFNDSVSLFTASYAQFAKYGRGAGKVPFSVIFDWVKSKSIQFDGLSQKSTAWAITKSISKKGTLNHVPNAPNVFEEAIEKHIDDFGVAVSLDLAREVSIQVRDAYLREIEKEIIFKI